MTPTIVTAALFVALIILDLLRHDYQLVAAHGFSGLFCVMAMAVLEKYNYTGVGWGLLMLPAVILVVGWGLQSVGHLKPYPTVVQPQMAEMTMNIR